MRHWGSFLLLMAAAALVGAWSHSPRHASSGIMAGTSAQATVTCPNVKCMKKNPPTNKFCEYCGRALASISKEQASKRLTSNVADDRSPSVGPDGRIVFQSNRDGDWDIYVMDSNGANVQKLTFNVTPDIDPQWCGIDLIVFVSTDDRGHFDIYTIKPNGSGRTRIVKNAYDDFSPTFGNGLIYFSNNSFGTTQLYSVRLDGSATKRLTDDSAYDDDPTVGPTGRIAFKSDRSGGLEIYSMNSDGSGTKRLTTRSGTDEQPNWGADGRICFVSRQPARSMLCVINGDGSGLRELSDWAGNSTEPSWGRNGHLVFVSDRDGNREIYTTSVR